MLDGAVMQLGERHDMLEAADWVIWNGSMGIVDMAALGRVEWGETGRLGFLAPPYDIVGPFDFDALESDGRILFGECLVMSRMRWQQDQGALRAEAMERRRAMRARLAMDEDERDYRDALELPPDGVLEPAEIRSAFRRLAKQAHPDAGGSDHHYRTISEARDALLRKFETI